MQSFSLYPISRRKRSRLFKTLLVSLALLSAATSGALLLADSLRPSYPDEGAETYSNEIEIMQLKQEITALKQASRDPCRSIRQREAAHNAAYAKQQQLLSLRAVLSTIRKAEKAEGQ